MGLATPRHAVHVSRKGGGAVTWPSLWARHQCSVAFPSFERSLAGGGGTGIIMATEPPTMTFMTEDPSRNGVRDKAPAVPPHPLVMESIVTHLRGERDAIDLHKLKQARAERLQAAISGEPVQRAARHTRTGLRSAHDAAAARLEAQKEREHRQTEEEAARISFAATKVSTLPAGDEM